MRYVDLKLASVRPFSVSRPYGFLVLSLLVPFVAYQFYSGSPFLSLDGEVLSLGITCCLHLGGFKYIHFVHSLVLA